MTDGSICLDSSISIHTLLAEGDLHTIKEYTKTKEFLSTPSLRRATNHEATFEQPPNISIHTLLAEGDRRSRKQRHPQMTFLSTPSLRRATISSSSAETAKTSFLSTPSLRRATWLQLFLYYQDNNFYPHPPCGGRQENPTQKREAKTFLSTPSLRRATRESDTEERSQDISIHTLLAEGDPEGPAKLPKRIDFYPHPPCGGRPPYNLMIHRAKKISIHTLLAEGDPWGAAPPSPPGAFLSTPSLRRATQKPNP